VCVTDVPTIILKSSTWNLFFPNSFTIQETTDWNLMNKSNQIMFFAPYFVLHFDAGVLEPPTQTFFNLSRIPPVRRSRSPFVREECVTSHILVLVLIYRIVSSSQGTK